MQEVLTVAQFTAQYWQLRLEIVHGAAFQLLKASDELLACENAHGFSFHVPAQCQDHRILRIDAQFLAKVQDAVVRDAIR